MNDGNHAGMPPEAETHNGAVQPWPPDEPMGIGEQPAEFATGLVSLAYIRAALRRSVRFCAALALAGLLAGAGYGVLLSSAYGASTSVYLPTDGQSANAVAAAAIATDLALAQSRAVAAAAAHKLGAPASLASLQHAYTVTDPTTEMLVITATAPSSSLAIRRANAVAAAFLGIRRRLQQSQASGALASLDLEIKDIKQQIVSINGQMASLASHPTSAGQQAKLSSLEAQLYQATTALDSASANVTKTNVQLALEGHGSKVLDSAYPLPHSRVKGPALAGAIGLLAGLALAVGIVVLRALTSDRLRWRDDVARALGAPVKLSVGAVRLGGRRAGRRALKGAERPEIRSIVDHLWDSVPKDSRHVSLAVVAVDDPGVAALSLASLAVSQAEAGMRVVLADLVSGAPAASVLDSGEPGVRTVRVQGTHVAVAVPDPDQAVPVGPRQRRGPLAGRTPPRDLVEVCASADVLLTLAALDPTIGGDHLRTWAGDAVVVVTAGRSSWTRVRAVGEMMRLAGVRISSAVLVDADKSDDSLGAALPPATSRGHGDGYEPFPGLASR